MYQRILFWGTLSLPGTLGLYSYLRFLESHHPNFLEQGLFFVFVSLVWFMLGTGWAYQQRARWSLPKLQWVVGILLGNVLIWAVISPFVNRTLNTEYVTIVNESSKSIDSIWIESADQVQLITNLPGLESEQVQFLPTDLNEVNLAVRLKKGQQEHRLEVHQRSRGFQQANILVINQQLKWVNHRNRMIQDQLDARQSKIRHQQWTAQAYQPASNLVQYHQQLSYFPVSGGMMAYLDIGPAEAPPVLLIHDGLTNGFLFRKIVHQLAEGGFRVIAPDLIGSGASDARQELDLLAPDQQARYLQELMEGLYLPSWTQVVYGQADFILYEQLVQYPEQLERLILLETTYSPQLKDQAIAARPPEALSSKVLLGLAYESWLSRWLATYSWRKRVGHRLDKALVQAYQEPLANQHRNTAWYWHTNIEKHLASWPRYHQICQHNPKPALMIRSPRQAADGPTAQRQAQQLIDHLGWSQPSVVFLEDCGNLSPEICPEELARKLLVFLRETS